jgi:hypothetical protein
MLNEAAMRLIKGKSHLVDLVKVLKY